MSHATFRPAVIADLPSLLQLQSAYYADDGYPFSESASTDAWTALLVDPSLGRAWVVEAESALVGHVVLTFGYSLEYRGRDAAIDELYVTPAWRGRGLGREALNVVEAACIQLGVKALHLEVEKDKTAAADFYRRRGFADHKRVLMTKWIGAAGPE